VVISFTLRLFFPQKQTNGRQNKNIEIVCTKTNRKRSKHAYDVYFFGEYSLISTDEKFLTDITCVIKVEPQRAVLNRKTTSAIGSPISSAMRWNVERGTTIRWRQKVHCARLKKGPYSQRHKCIPDNTATKAQDNNLPVLLKKIFGLLKTKLPRGVKSPQNSVCHKLLKCEIR